MYQNKRVGDLVSSWIRTGVNPTQGDLNGIRHILNSIQMNENPAIDWPTQGEINFNDVIKYVQDCIGGGYVVGPGSAVDDNFASFNGTTGAIIQDSGYSSASFEAVGAVATHAGLYTVHGLSNAGSYTLTIPATGTVAEGTGAASYVAYWSDTNTLTGASAFAYTPTAATNLALTRTFTLYQAGSPATDYYGSYRSIVVQPGGDSSYGYYYANSSLITVYVSNTQPIGYVVGEHNSVVLHGSGNISAVDGGHFAVSNHCETGDVTDIKVLWAYGVNYHDVTEFFYGLQSNVDSWGGTIALARAGRFRIQNSYNLSVGIANPTMTVSDVVYANTSNTKASGTGTQTIGTAYGFHYDIDNDGTITTSYGIYLGTPANTGTLTNHYGIYLADQTVSGSTLNYAIYVAGGASYFAGAVTMASTVTIDTYTLDLTANASLGGTNTGDNAANSLYDIGSDTQAWNAKLDTFAALPDAHGWLHSSGAGVYSWTTPTYTEVGAAAALGADDNYVTDAEKAALHAAVSLATDHGLSLAGQVIAMGTPSTVTASSTNAVTTTTHSHAITGFSETSHTHTDVYEPHDDTLTALAGLVDAAGYLKNNGTGTLSWETPSGSPHDALTLDTNANAFLSLSTQELGLDTQTANYVFAGPTSGGAAVPTFRALVAGDIPALSYGDIYGTGIVGQVAEFVTDTKYIQAANLIAPANLLTLVAGGAYSLTIPATCTVAGLGLANVFTTQQTIEKANVYQDPAIDLFVFSHSATWQLRIQSEWPLVGGEIDYHFVHNRSGTDYNMLTFHLGNVGIGTKVPNAKLAVFGTDPAVYGLVVKASASQVANLVAIEKSDTTLLSGFDAEGRVFSYGITGITSNVLVGSAGKTTMTSTNCVLVGAGAGAYLTSGSNNVFIGYHAGYYLTSGTYNFALGYGAMGGDTNTADNNLAIGTSSLANTTTGGNNLAFGHMAQQNHTTGHYNLAFGTESFSTNSGATHGNLGIGYRTGYACTGSYNIFLGYMAGRYQTAVDNYLIIDYADRGSAAVELTNAIIFGVMAATPAGQALTINAALKVVGTTQFGGGVYTWPASLPASNKVLQSTDAGVLTWESSLTNPMDAIGELIYGGAAGAPTALSAGTAGQALVSGGGAAPVWDGVSGITLLVAASDAAASTIARADYVCDGTIHPSTYSTATGTYQGCVDGDDGKYNDGGTALIDGTGTNGYFYVCDDAGTYDYGNPSGNSIELALGDAIIYSTVDNKWHKAGDYADESTIQAAIDALPATGGTIVLSEGTFVIANNLYLDSYTTLRGQGTGVTVIQTAKYRTKLYLCQVVNRHAGGGGSETDLRICDLTVDGNDANQIYDATYVIYTSNHGIWFKYVTASSINNVKVINPSAWSIRIENSSGIHLSNIVVIPYSARRWWRDCIHFHESSHCTLNNFYFYQDSLDDSLAITGGATGSHDIMVSNGTIVSVADSAYWRGRQIYIGHNIAHGDTYGDEAPNTDIKISNVSIEGGGNIFIIGLYGISGETWTLDSYAENIQLDNVSIRDSASSVNLYPSGSMDSNYNPNMLEVRGVKRSTFNNMVIDTGLYIGAELRECIGVTFSNSQVYHMNNVGVYVLYSDHCIVSGNIVDTNSQLTDNWASNILIADADYNSIIGNKCRQGSTAYDAKYGIEITSGTANMVFGNDLYDSGQTGDFSDSGTGTMHDHNLDIDANAWV